MREQLLPVLTDLDEVGDVTSCAAWDRYEIGEYREAETWASEGAARTDVAVTFRLHSCAWRCVARFRLGDWDGAINDFRTIRELLDERQDEPPYFVSHAYGAALLIDHARGASPEMERLADVLNPIESSSEGRFTRLRPWLGMLSVVRHDFARAHELLDDLPPGWRIHGGEVFEARCELVRAEAAWESAPCCHRRVAGVRRDGRTADPGVLRRPAGGTRAAGDRRRRRRGPTAPERPGWVLRARGPV